MRIRNICSTSVIAKFAGENSFVLLQLVTEKLLPIWVRSNTHETLASATKSVLLAVQP